MHIWTMTRFSQKEWHCEGNKVVCLSVDNLARVVDQQEQLIMVA
jgi:hypothetical protein